MTNKSKVALVAGSSFLAGGAFKAWLDRREERKERERLERKELKEKLREQQDLTERLERKLDQLNAKNG